MGDDSYDLVLYAGGEDNRVKVTDVLASSPAQLAGLQVGDVILLYGEQPLFSPHDLIRLTREAALGSTVAMIVLRNGEELRVFVPGGGLGAAVIGTTGRP
jgi:S1-C subfamily serine protease